MAKHFWTFNFKRNFFETLLMMWLAMEGRNRTEEDEEVINGLSVTFRISVVFDNSLLLACLLVPGSSN